MIGCCNKAFRHALLAALLAGVGASAAGQSDWQPGQSFRDCEGCPEMVVVPAGSYMMGSPPGEESRKEHEGPQHRVTIAQPFAVGKYEVTVEEWSRFVEATGYPVYTCDWWGISGLERNPVECVIWEDAQAYVAWLSRKTGKHYRLLSGAEWEYAARAGTTTARYWGESESGQCRHANGADAAAGDAIPFSGPIDWESRETLDCDDGHVFTAPVGSFAPNPFGLYDMLGNVEEWVESCRNNRYNGAPDDGSAGRTGYADCEVHVLRGGSWVDLPGNLRAAARNPDGGRLVFYGFRVARTLAP